MSDRYLGEVYGSHWDHTIHRHSHGHWYSADIRYVSDGCQIDVGQV